MAHAMTDSWHRIKEAPDLAGAEGEGVTTKVVNCNDALYSRATTDSLITKYAGASFA